MSVDSLLSSNSPIVTIYKTISTVVSSTIKGGVIGFAYGLHFHYDVIKTTQFLAATHGVAMSVMKLLTRVFSEKYCAKITLACWIAYESTLLTAGAYLKILNTPATLCLASAAAVKVALLANVCLSKRFEDFLNACLS